MVFYWQENLKNKCHFRVRPFSTAKLRCVHDHVKPTVQDVNLDCIILHCGTNDLNPEQTASQIARSIIELALSLKSKNNKISVSLIVPRNDNLNNKASEVNCRLVHMCAERNIPYIDHTNSIQPENHLNESKLHFNRYGTIAFANSISKFLSKYYWWCRDSSNFDHLFQENFDKESKSFSQLSHKENHRRVSSPSKTIVLNETSLESEESFLLDQSTSSTLTHELNLDPYSNIENIRSKNPNRLIIAQLKACVCYFHQFFFFHQTIALQKLWKMLFISSKKPFSFSRNSIFCISALPFFSTCQLLLLRMIEDKS